MKKKQLSRHNVELSHYAKHTLLILCLLFMSYGMNAQEERTYLDGGTISTNDNTEICIDGISTPIYVNLEGERGPTNRMKWIITDFDNNILALPEAPPFDFEGAGSGVCKIWHISYRRVRNLREGRNLSQLRGWYDLSNYLTITRNQPEGGVLSGGLFEFIVGDGVADNIPEGAITLSGNSGAYSQWVVTDSDGNILGLPPSPYVVDFDGAGDGTCLVWHLSFDGELEGAMMGTNASDLIGCYSLSNPIEVIRYDAKILGGTLDGGPYEFCVGDGEEDNIPEGTITLSGNQGENSQWVVTDSEGNILGLPPSPYVVNFDGAGAGTCLLWHLSFNGDLEGAMMGANASDLVGDYDLSNPITIVRNQPEGGVLSGGSFEFIVGDGIADNIPEGAITLSGNSGAYSQWVVTDSDGNILGLPPSPYVVDFDGAGDGTCLVWHLSFDGELEGAMMGTNASDLMGCYSLSNPIEVIRKLEEKGCKVNGGNLQADKLYFFCVGDNEPDYATGITLNNNEGANSQWVVTDTQGTILGLPPSPEVVDFDVAGTGVCLIWHLSFEDGIMGAEIGNNAFSDLSGCYSLSNPIAIFRFPSEGFICELISYLKVEDPIEISMYPNPAKDKINFDFKNLNDEEINVKIYNFSNIELYNRSYNKSEFSKKVLDINVNHLPQGFYLVSITNINGEIIAVKRLVIE